MTEVPGYSFATPGGVPTGIGLKVGTAPYSLSMQSVAANNTSIQIDSSGDITFTTKGNEFPSDHDSSLSNTRAEFQTLERMPSKTDLWMKTSIFWDGTLPPLWALFSQIQQNGTDNLLNPSTPIFFLEVDAGIPNTLTFGKRHQIVADGVDSAVLRIWRKTVTINVWNDIVIFARLTKGGPDGILKCWINKELIVDYRGPLGYPVADQYDIGVSPRFGCYRGVTPAEATTPITFGVKMKNMYAGQESLLSLVS
jgi:uncharacterized protein (DUF3820 family)